jgi:hypothetical protein
MNHTVYQQDEKRKFYTQEYCELMNAAIQTKGCKWSRYFLLHDNQNYVIILINNLVYDESNNNWDFMYGNLTVAYAVKNRADVLALWDKVGF